MNKAEERKRKDELMAILKFIITQYNCGNLQAIQSQGKMVVGDHYDFEIVDGKLYLLSK